MMTLALILIVALSISFLCSLLEACVLSLSNADLAMLEERHPRIGRIWRGFKENLQYPLAVILILNTFAHTVGASLSGAQFEKLYGDEGLLPYALVISFVMIQWTEILPKTLGAQFNRRLAPAIAVPLEAAIRVMKPFVWLVQFLNRPFERRDKSDAASTVQEIHALARMALMERVIAPHQEKIITGTTRLSQRAARQIMVPREEIGFLSTSMTLHEALIKAHQDMHTRYPLCDDGDLDRIVGYVNLKELVAIMRTNPNDGSLRGIARSVLFVSDRETGADILRRLVDQHEHIAIVRDEAGKTLGLATMEDVIEELVGERRDELDLPPRMFHALGERTFMVGGGFAMADLAERLRIALPDASGSVSDWMVERLGHAPQPNESVSVGNAAFTVRRIRRGLVFEAMVTLQERA